MARHRSDVAPAPADSDPRTLVRSGRAAAPSSPAVGLPVVGVAPETNRLDLAAIALASARPGGTGTTGGFPMPPAPRSPALGIPVARSAPPASGPVPVSAAPPSHGAGPGRWRELLGTRRAVAGLALVGAVAGAGVAVIGVAGALTGSDPVEQAPAQLVPAQQAPTPQDSTPQDSGY